MGYVNRLVISLVIGMLLSEPVLEEKLYQSLRMFSQTPCSI